MLKATTRMHGTPAQVLATDLDGTFLGGGAKARAALARHFGDDPSRRLVYVTGRSTRSVIRLVAAGELPTPDAMICDVGAFVAHGDGRAYDGAITAEISAAWGDRSDVVRATLADLAALRLQEYFGPYRVSYYFDSTEVLVEARARVDALDLDSLISDNLYFDVLPRGVNKGTTLRRLLAEWQVADENVLVAGDTLNDLAMLASGLPAVVVGNAEAALLAALPRSDRIVRATAHGCDGILEALAHRGVEVSRV
jgi:hydroxymethylpyrimidine pyrophosphatase-like HAD family hydrolase